jgi:hypothetical protein
MCTTVAGSGRNPFMTTTTTSEVPPPSGAHTLSTWEEWGGDYRVVWGADRLVPASDISLAPHAVQLRDGSIDDGAVAEPLGIAVEEIGDDGRRGEHFSVTVQGARNLAEALLAAADELDGWATR